MQYFIKNQNYELLLVAMQFRWVEFKFEFEFVKFYLEGKICYVKISVIDIH